MPDASIPKDSNVCGTTTYIGKYNTRLLLILSQ